MGERQLVEIARMLTRDAKVLLLDEPTATLSDIEIEHIFAALMAIKREGRSIVYITHRLSEVFQICDSVTVLRNGEHVGTHTVADLDRQALIELMLGRSFVEMYPEPPHSADVAMMTVDNLNVPGIVHDFSMSVPKGKIVCIAGQVGSGALEVIDALAGLVYDASGRITVNGKVLPLGSAARALKQDVMFISGDRAEEGIFRHCGCSIIWSPPGSPITNAPACCGAGRCAQSRGALPTGSRSTAAGCARRPTNCPAATSRSSPSAAASIAAIPACW